MSAKYISSQEIEKLYLDGDYRIYILDKIKNEGELVFEKMPRDCVNKNLFWHKIYSTRLTGLVILSFIS